MRKLFTLLTVPVLAASVFSIALQPASSKPPQQPVSEPINLTAHIQDFGDIQCNAGEWCGTTGSAKRLEGFALKLSNFKPQELGVSYSAHIQDLGNTPLFRNGEFVGTRGKATRLEGFSIQLTGAKAKRYKVLYQCHIQNKGDSPVLSNGEFCGTRGQSLRVEAMKVWVVKR